MEESGAVVQLRKDSVDDDDGDVYNDGSEDGVGDGYIFDEDVDDSQVVLLTFTKLQERLQ